MVLGCRRFVEQQGSKMDYAVAVDSRGEAGQKLMGAAGKDMKMECPKALPGCWRWRDLSMFSAPSSVCRPDEGCD